MKRFKLLKCYHCGNMFITQAIKQTKCRYCGKTILLSRAYKLGYVLYESDEWSDINNYMDKTYYGAALKEARRKFRSYTDL